MILCVCKDPTLNYGDQSDEDESIDDTTYAPENDEDEDESYNRSQAGRLFTSA